MHITIAVSAFQHEVWQKTFFPDDLPKDWRFDYYANEFDSILLSCSALQQLGETCVAEMLLDASPAFIFVFENDEAQNKVFDTDSGVLQVKFSSEVALALASGISIVEDEIINQQNISGSACVLRASSIHAVNNEEIKQLLLSVFSEFSQFDQVYLFFEQNLQELGAINAAKVINDLL